MNLKKSLKLKTGHVLRNRLLLPAMASQTANERGFVTSRTLEHYERLLEARPGLALVEYTYVHRSGRSEPRQLAVDDIDKLEGLSELAQLIKSKDAVALLQIVHGGAKSSKDLTGGRLIGASSIAVPSNRESLEVPDEASLHDIQEIQMAFFQAALLAHKAGFDGVELHCAHGYGLNQWISPITNQRKDDYGGSLEKRLKILEHIVSEIKNVAPNKILSLRIPGQDLFPGGLSQEDMLQVAQKMEHKGADILNVSSGIGGWRRPKERRGQGYLVEEARNIQQGVQVPVVGVGGITDVDYINEAIEQNSFSLAAVGRDILNDPEKWKKLLS